MNKDKQYIRDIVSMNPLGDRITVDRITKKITRHIHVQHHSHFYKGRFENGKLKLEYIPF